MGAFNIMFRDLFQVDGYQRSYLVSAMTLFYIAIGVFGLMIVGLYLSVREFLEASKNPAKQKGSDPAHKR
jgi:uncharacterized BrkB/YihY/UPF0761 family membrane protein